MYCHENVFSVVVLTDCVQAGLSLSMCTVAWMKRAVPEKTKAAVMGVCTTLVTAFACLTIFVVTETALDIRQVCNNTATLVCHFLQHYKQTTAGRAAYCPTQAINTRFEVRAFYESGHLQATRVQLDSRRLSNIYLVSPRWASR